MSHRASELRKSRISKLTKKFTRKSINGLPESGLQAERTHRRIRFFAGQVEVQKFYWVTKSTVENKS